MRSSNLNQLTQEQLQHLYDQQERELHQRLLQGASWDDVRTLRRKVTRYAEALFNKLSKRQSNHSHE